MRLRKQDVLAGCQEADELLSAFNSCNLCSLCEHEGNKPVIYRGNLRAPIALVGEAPGKVEQELEKPFVGPAGELQDKIYQAIDIDTDHDMYLTNVCWCRPTAPWGSGKQNYTPKQEQVDKCWPFTKKLIELTGPKILIACGLPALKSILGIKTARMGDFEGKWLDQDGRKVFVTRHPASLLHLARDPQAQRQAKAKVWEYMQFFRDTYREHL